jgi:large repetitive protein
LALFLALAMSALAAGCGDNITPPPKDDDPLQVVKVCEELAPLSSGVCSVQAGGESKVIKGNVLTPGITYEGGQVAFGADGIITCVGCDCEGGGETVITCPQAAISPGLINTHDHITYALNQPAPDTGERWEHRHDWRDGLRGHSAVDVPQTSSADAVRFGELRFLFGGGTSTNGSGGQAGILRNLDRDNLLEGITQSPIHYQTFPLGDSGSTQRRATCNYGGSSSDTSMSIANDEAYTPHIAEGIDSAARNEFFCASSDAYDTVEPGLSTDLIESQTAVIHGTGLLPADFNLMAKRNTALIWSPRTNVSLYGNTAQVTAASRLGVQIALGSDWIASGSTNMLRELQCADELNTKYYNHFFTSSQLWRMATVDAAAAVAMDDAIGSLVPGNVADISIFDGTGRATAIRAVIDSEPKNVALVLRGGKPLYGDQPVLAALRTDCDTVDVCGNSKQVCLMDEIGKTWDQLLASVGSKAYPAFYCGVPEKEPTCKPSRAASVAGSTIYTGDLTTADKDGDGIANAADNCPDVFNPIRPVDGGKQGDADGDGKGDACDACPLTAGSDSCAAISADDRDGDGKGDAADNCPLITNVDQTDGDSDGKGDACDDCPMGANAGNLACPATIYAVKKGIIPVDATVKITNALVTAKGFNGFFVQVKDGDSGYDGANFSGLFVFTTNAPFLTAATVGGRVDLEGQLSNFVGQLQLAPTAVDRVGATTEALPTPVVATTAELAVGGARFGQLESVIVQTATSTITAINVGSKEFTATQAALNLIVDDFLFATPYFPGVGQSYATLAGVFALRSGAPRLLPRSALDLDPIARLAPLPGAPFFVRVGETASIPQGLVASLTMPVRTDTIITITSSDDTKLKVTGGGVTIPACPSEPPACTISAPVVLEAIAPAAAVTLTFTVGTQTTTTTVRVLDPADAPTSFTLSPEQSIGPGGTATFTATLDVPANTGGAAIDLTIDPTTFGTVSAQAVFVKDQLTATFNVVNTPVSTAEITATITGTAAFAAQAKTTTAKVVLLPVINEIDYDQPGTDTAEYVEIYNPSSQPFNLANMALVFVNGSGTGNHPEYKRALIAGANGGVLPGGGYLVIGVQTIVVAPGGILYTPPNWSDLDIQNGGNANTTNAPDGVVLLDVSTNRIYDRLSYEGSLVNAMIDGIAGTVNLVEGTAVPAAQTDPAAAGSMSRIPNGVDTNNAANDWKLTNTLTPGAANIAN